MHVIHFTCVIISTLNYYYCHITLLTVFTAEVVYEEFILMKTKLFSYLNGKKVK